jgi:hypothetical protein
VITKSERTRLQRAINRLVNAERWLAREEQESEQQGQTQHLNAARRECEGERAYLSRVLDSLMLPADNDGSA